MHLDVHYSLHIGRGGGTTMKNIHPRTKNPHKTRHLIQKVLLVRDIRHLQRNLHSSYFPQITDCLAHGSPTVYEIQTFQQLKL